MILQAFQLILLGVLLGGLYALVGIGFSLVFGVINVGNVAHGDFMILAAYLAHSLITTLGIDPLFSIILVMPCMFLFGVFIQRFLINKFLHSAPESILILAFCISLIMENSLLILFKEESKTLGSQQYLTSYDVMGILKVPISYLLDFILALASMITLYIFLHKTYLGRAIRAAADDAEAAELLGVNTNVVYAYCFGVSLVFAAIAGVLVGITFSFNPVSGVGYLGICLCVAVIGGLGSMKGTFVGGLILGLAQILGGRCFGIGYQVLIGYIILILVLVIRPQGLFGKGEGKGGRK
jgi:branched-chain amino acid transport system permease protein